LRILSKVRDAQFPGDGFAQILRVELANPVSAQDGLNDLALPVRMGEAQHRHDRIQRRNFFRRDQMLRHFHRCLIRFRDFLRSQGQDQSQGFDDAAGFAQVVDDRHAVIVVDHEGQQASAWMINFSSSESFSPVMTSCSINGGNRCAKTASGDSVLWFW
jgi:hypothetical protein